MLDLFTELDDFGKNLNVKVTAKASSNRIKIENLPNGEKLIKVYVTVPAENGKANKEVIRLLAKSLGIAPSRLTITHGITSRDKIISIE